jgi:hypothetical protein
MKKFCVNMGPWKHCFELWPILFLEGEREKLKCKPVQRKAFTYKSLTPKLQITILQQQQNIQSIVLVLPHLLYISLRTVVHVEKFQAL